MVILICRCTLYAFSLDLDHCVKCNAFYTTARSYGARVVSTHSRKHNSHIEGGNALWDTSGVTTVRAV